MQRPCLLLLLLAFLALNARSQDTIHLFYDLDRWQLTSQHGAALEDWVERIGERDGLVLIEGYADATGAAVYNMRLSGNRASTVEAFLNAHGFSDDQIRVVFYGEKTSHLPVAIDNRIFRRVDVRFLEFKSPDENMDNSPLITSKALLAMMAPRTQFIKFNNRFARKVTGMDGVVIRMDRHAFKTKYDPSYREEIVLQLREYVKPMHFLSAGFHAQTGRMLLELQGMIYYQMTTERGEQLKVKHTKSMTVGFPTDTLKDEVEHFATHTNNAGLLSWTRRRGSQRDYIQIAEGRMYRESRSKRDVNQTMGVETHDVDDPVPVRLYQSKVDEFGYIAYALPKRLNKTGSLKVACPQADSSVMAYAFLENGKAILNGLWSAQEQAFLFPHLPLETDVRVVLLHTEGTYAQTAFAETKLLAKQQQIKLELLPLTANRLLEFEGLIESPIEVLDMVKAKP